MLFIHLSSYVLISFDWDVIVKFVMVPFLYQTQLWQFLFLCCVKKIFICEKWLNLNLLLEDLNPKVMWCSSINTARALKFSQFAIRLLKACKDWNEGQIFSLCFKLFPRILLGSIFPTVGILLQYILFHIKHASCPFGLVCFKWKYDRFFTMYSVKIFYFGFHNVLKFDELVPRQW